MDLIEYRGPHPRVDVPLAGLDDVPARVPIEVSPEVAEMLTLGGTSSTWFRVKTKAKPAPPAPAGKE